MHQNAKPILSHYSCVHCGVEILPMSKNIVNCVCGCANDCGFKTYHQDTDSIHLNYDGVDTIVNRCTKKYNKDLVGQSLCQFQVDFPKKDGHEDVYAIGSMF